MSAARSPLVLLAALAALAGCGADRTLPPDVSTPARAEGERTVEIPAAGVSFTAPRTWSSLAAQDSRAGGVQSGTATLAVWRYPRSEDLPRAGGELDTALRRLVAQVRRRSTGVRIDSRRTTRVGDAPALELTTTQTTAGSVRRYRSLHVFADGAEIVLDGSAPPDQFRRVDRTVYRPALRTLRLGAPTG